ncbi:MAG: DEAD/DEAH box helicase [Bacteroidales bacterium]|jgi:SNF2 family DNA or RNA helicase|nr:DEAD/DEAH box helicase [Bacteroidales bacterium]
MNYQEFLDSKTQLTGNFGFDPLYMPEIAFDFQRHITKWALKKGRAALFVDTGLGKTLMQLTLAENIIRKTNGNVLILTPLAVAFQFMQEAEKIGVHDIEHCKDGKFNKKIVVSNYERLDKFNSKDFECVILDESSILKNFDGKFKTAITDFMKKTKYRFLSTATPAPNDYIELGTSSEALGHLGHMDMLGMYFGNNENNIRPQEIAVKWYLKPHAHDAFFKFVNSWAMSVKKPSDIGYSDEKYILPELIKNYHKVKNEENLIRNGQMLMFNEIAKTMTEVRQEQKNTITKRCEKAVELAKNKTSVYWTNFNRESELLNELDKDAVEIKGSMSIDKKEEILLNFSKGEIKRIITKPKMTSFGLNWQHCNHTVYFPTWSYEQYYQAIRRFWRFGQKKPVTVDLVFSDGQERVMKTLELKTENAYQLQEKLNKNLHGFIDNKKNKVTKKITLPNFIKG